MSEKVEQPKTATRPTHRGYKVIKKEGGDKKPFWQETGAAIWPHEDGEGFTLRVPEGISISGETVFRTIKDKETAA